MFHSHHARVNIARQSANNKFGLIGVDAVLAMAIAATASNDFVDGLSIPLPPA
jgi:hypothetical protein